MTKEINFTCTIAGASVPLRAEGLTELIGRIEVTFACDQPKVNPQRFNITVILNTSITNRARADGTTDAVARIRMGNSHNVVHGHVSSINSILFPSIEVAEGRTTCEITGIRVNAAMLGVSTMPQPTLVVAYVSMQASVATLVPQPQVDVGRITPSLFFDAGDRVPTRSNEFDLQTAAALTFREAQPGTFKDRQREAGGLDEGSSVTHGTRLMATFSDVPRDVDLYVGNRNVSEGEPSALYVQTDASGATGRPNLDNATESMIHLSNRRYAVWEWVDIKESVSQKEVVFAVAAFNRSSDAREDKIVIRGSFAPISQVTTNSGNAPIPRFIDTGLQKVVMVKSIPGSLRKKG